MIDASSSLTSPCSRQVVFFSLPVTSFCNIRGANCLFKISAVFYTTQWEYNFQLVLLNACNLGDGAGMWRRNKLSASRGWREGRKPAFEKPSLILTTVTSPYI